MDADPSYRNSVDGLAAPSRERHEMIFWIEPRLGVPLQVEKRAMINFDVGAVANNEDWPATRWLRPGGVVPLAWTDETVTAPDDVQV